MSETIEVVVKNAFKHGEGPHWDDTTQCLYYVDNFAGDVKRYNAVTGEDSRLHLGKSACSIIIPCQTEGFVVTQKTDMAIVDSWESGRVTIIAKVECDPVLLNDGKVDASGRLWIGSCFCDHSVADQKKWLKQQGSLYSVDADGNVRKHISKVNISNGIDWTDDNRVMYFIDSLPRQVWAFDFDIEVGTISNQRTVADFSSTEISDLGYPDGMTVDTEGKLWVACFDAGKVVRLDPETGKVIHTVKFPAKKITSCCFGGKYFSDLYVTSSSYKLTPEGLKKYPLTGSVFKVTVTGVKGRKANKFAW